MSCYFRKVQYTESDYRESEVQRGKFLIQAEGTFITGGEKLLDGCAGH